MLSKYGLVNTRGKIDGHCNICMCYGRLTADHVPPKGINKVSQVDLFHIIEMLSMERPIGKRKYRHLQNGVNFRSLCASCNNGLLGAKYDPALIYFSNSVLQFLKSAIHLPQVTNINVQPGLVARSILGHLFAVGLERTERTPLLSAAADFVLNDSLPLPTGIEIYYWVYPYRRLVALRDVSMVTSFGSGAPPIVFWCLKYFPLGFMVTWGNEQPDRIALPYLSQYMLNAGTHFADVQINLGKVPHQFWPEAPSSEGALLYGDAAIGAIPHSDTQ